MFITYPFTTAVEFPICIPIYVEPSLIVILLVVGIHSIVPPNASTIALIGRRVLLFLIIGGESRVLAEPFTVKVDFPI